MAPFQAQGILGTMRESMVSPHTYACVLCMCVCGRDIASDCSTNNTCTRSSPFIYVKVISLGISRSERERWFWLGFRSYKSKKLQSV